MTLRTRLLVALIALATAATVSIGSLAYFETEHQLDSEINTSLREVAAYAVTPDRGHDGGPGGPPDVHLQTLVVQQLNPDGSVAGGSPGITIPVSSQDRAIASGSEKTSTFRDLVIDHLPYRMLTAPNDRGGALQVLRPLAERNSVLSTLRLRIVVAASIVIALAALTGWLLARQITRRLTRLAAAAGLVAETGRLDVSIPVSGTDEVTQVASAFERMLAALHRSELAQQRLVQDAGHELRTPLTSLRTNLDVLGRYPELPAGQRETVIADLHSEARELSALVNELVEITSGEAAAREPVRLVLGEAVAAVVERARRRTSTEIVLHADDSVVLADVGSLERAIGNLVDNALKFSPADTQIEVLVVAGRVEVRDLGAGLDAADLPRIFDRFYRSDAARALPGSGLGLAIVNDVVIAHGGSVFAANHADGGAVIGFTLPVQNATG